MLKVATLHQSNTRPYHDPGGKSKPAVCLVTKQNLQWPIFIPTPIPPPLDWMGIESVKWLAQSQDTQPHADISFLSKSRGRLSMRPFLTQRPVQSKKKTSYPMSLCVLNTNKLFGMRVCSGPVVNHCPTGYQQPPPSKTQFNYGRCSKNRVTGNIYNSNSNYVWIPFHRKSLP